MNLDEQYLKRIARALWVRCSFANLNSFPVHTAHCIIATRVSVRRISRTFVTPGSPECHPASCPFALNTAPAAGVVRNLISAFAADESFEPPPTPAWKAV